MKKFLFSICLMFSFLFIFNNAHADDSSDVKQFSINMINHYQNDIFRSSKSKSEKLKQFNKEFVELFDMKSIIPVVLGTEYKKASAEQIQKFQSAFIDFNLKTFAKYFDDYANRDFKFISVIPAKNKNQYFVKMEIINPANAKDTVSLQWRFKKQDNTYKVIDAVIADVSMILNYKTEYGNIIKQANLDGKNGIDVLTQKILEKNNQIKK